jgi:hypothetical protein
MSITFTITSTNNITSFDETNLSSNLNTTLTIATITDSENVEDTIANNDFVFEWYIVDKPSTSNASIIIAANDMYRSSITLNSIDVWGTYRIFVTAMNNNSGLMSEVNVFVAPEPHFINLSVKSTNNNLEKPAITQRDWNDIYNDLTDTVDNTTKRINQLKVTNDKTLILPVDYGTSGQVLTTLGDGNLNWQFPGAGSSLTGLTSNGSNITISNGYTLLPGSGNSLNDIGGGINPNDLFDNIFVTNTFTDTINSLTFPDTDGTEFQVLTTNGVGVIEFQSVSYNNLTDKPTITQIIKADSGQETLTFGSGRTLDILGGSNSATTISSTASNITVTVNSSLSGGSSDTIASGDSSIQISDITNDITFTTNAVECWTINNSGHILPSSNSSFDIGSAEYKVRHLYLSDNTLNINDVSLSVGTNDQMSSTSSNKSLDFNVSSISLKNYDFNSLQIEPEAILSGSIYRIINAGSIDFKQVGAKNNDVGHIFEATTDGTIFTNDGIASLNQSNTNPTSNYVYVQNNDIDNNKIDLKYNDGITSRNIVAVSSSGIQNNSVLSYNSGEWSGYLINDLTHKVWHANHDNEWIDTLTFIDNGNKYLSQTGPSSYIFSFCNNTSSSLVIKKISISCNEMYSDNIKWSASFATSNEFVTNISETLPQMSVVNMSKQNAASISSGTVGIGFSEWNDDTYNQNGQLELQTNNFLLISINYMASIDPSYKNKRFTATVYYA